MRDVNVRGNKADDKLFTQTIANSTDPLNQLLPTKRNPYFHNITERRKNTTILYHNLKISHKIIFQPAVSSVLR